MTGNTIIRMITKKQSMRLSENEPHQSVMSECKALEEHAHRLDIKNDDFFLKR